MGRRVMAVLLASVALCGLVPQGRAAEPFEKRGCCSHHRGVCGCSDGRAQCCDGELSPTCGC